MTLHSCDRLGTTKWVALREIESMKKKLEEADPEAELDLYIELDIDVSHIPEVEDDYRNNPCQ